MKFTEEQYQNNLDYVKCIFTLGGQSECGKTSAGIHFREMGVRKSKIIQMEHDMMKDRGFDISTGATSDMYESLYKGDQEAAFREFLFRFIDIMKEDGTPYASLESLYRAPLGAFLQKELGEKCANIYIKAPLEIRAQREMLKINQKAESEGSPTITLEEMLAKVTKKDKNKEKLRPTDVEKIADYVVLNDASVTKEDFLTEISMIAREKGYTI